MSEPPEGADRLPGLMDWQLKALCRWKHVERRLTVLIRPRGRGKALSRAELAATVAHWRVRRASE